MSKLIIIDSKSRWSYSFFVNRAIEAGEVIIRESPLILMPQKIFDDNDPDYIENWLTRRINRMTSEEREIFFSLADSR